MDASPILFISDLHLEANRPDITQAFFEFLQHKAAKAKAPYILGDFFPIWLGDGDDSDLKQLVAEKLSKLADQGAAIYMMHGNRDFLLGIDYASRCSATLIFEPYVLEESGLRILLMHGDILCTRDHDY